MAIFQLGSIIKNRREALGFSQEDLADGICSVPTLSRIENGERMPTKNHFEMLMQRLGYSAMSLDFFTDKRDFLIHELKFKIRHAYIENRIILAREYLEEYKNLLDKPTPIDAQFTILYTVLLCEGHYSHSEELKLFEDALVLTCPKYLSNVIPQVLSYEEIILLNNIAICNNSLGNRKRAIDILSAVKNFFERHMVCSEEALRTQTMVLYNLSKFLGLNGRYDECIEVCDIGIKLARNTGRCLHLGLTLYNRAWALIKRNHSGDRSQAEATLKQAICLAVAMDNPREESNFRKLYLDHFTEDT